MSIWATSDGNSLSNDNAKDEASNGGTGFKPIPDNTHVKAISTTAKIAEYNGDQFLKIRWDIVAGPYLKRVLFHKIHIFDKNPEKRDKAIKMLGAIAKLNGGGLFGCDNPTNDDFQVHLCKKIPIDLTIGHYQFFEDDGTTIRSEGNNVSGVSTAKASVQKQASAPIEAQGQQESPPIETPPSDENGFDEDIPF